MEHGALDTTPLHYSATSYNVRIIFFQLKPKAFALHVAACSVPAKKSIEEQKVGKISLLKNQWLIEQKKFRRFLPCTLS